jgi:hypothetical protein
VSSQIWSCPRTCCRVYRHNSATKSHRLQCTQRTGASKRIPKHCYSLRSKHCHMKDGLPISSAAFCSVSGRFSSNTPMLQRQVTTKLPWTWRYTLRIQPCESCSRCVSSSTSPRGEQRSESVTRPTIQQRFPRCLLHQEYASACTCEGRTPIRNTTAVATVISTVGPTLLPVSPHLSQDPLAFL